MPFKAVVYSVDEQGNYVMTPENFNRLKSFGDSSNDSYEDARKTAKEAVENLLKVSGATSVFVNVEADSPTPAARIQLEY